MMRRLLLWFFSTRTLAATLAERRDFSGLLVCRVKADLFGSTWVWKANDIGSRVDAIELLEWLSTQFPDEPTGEKKGSDEQ